MMNSAISPSTTTALNYSSRSSASATNEAQQSLPQTKLSKIGRKSFTTTVHITSALLDRLLHHAETQVIEGKSYRMKDLIEA